MSAVWEFEFNEFKMEPIFFEVTFLTENWKYGILLPKSFWEKMVLVIEKNLKFEAEGREFEKLLRSLEQFIQTVEGENIFW